MMEKFKRYLSQYFEHVFVLLILLATSIINYYIPYKIAFLNFYFLPIILGAYYLGQKRAMLGAVFSALLVLGYMLLTPSAFLAANSTDQVFLHLSIWSGFLILAGAVVGKLQENLKLEVANARKLNTQLAQSQQELNDSNIKLLDNNHSLEDRVQERTQELQQSKSAIESLKSKVEMALYSTMDSTVVNLMIEGRLRNEKRLMSVMFVDLVGFTSYSEDIRPENVVADLNRYLQDMEPVMLAYHGHIDKYMGDGIMCEFGVPQEFVMHRLMAVTCALKMQAMLTARAHPWKMRVGIASGAAIAGLIGSHRQTYTAIGDIVNLAARLEQNCNPGRILVDKFTHEDIQPFFETRKLRVLSTRKDLDLRKEQELDSLVRKIIAQPGNAQLHYQIGQIHLNIQEPVEALQYFEAALRLEPKNDTFKIAYAEAGINIKSQEQISVKGKRHRIEAFEVISLKDPLLNRNKIPQALYEKYQYVAAQISIPEDVTLPSEVMDGSVGQSRVVAVLSFILADNLGLSESDKRDILQAGFLADIGKELISPNLRNRRGGLTISEIDIIQQHPEESCRLMRKMGYDKPAVLKLVKHSHEHYRGSGGYPNQLKGNDIPIGARIIAVADAYEALTSSRPYRESWERHAALGEINSEVEKGVFDPVVVEVLAKLIA
ncbi:MAG: adenylate/guanylate cyclase domain-containing protein [Rhodoferax sp.]|nr:adenylate/guanylate cyclase domain-containing protein [Rhodoferax sp.]